MTYVGDDREDDDVIDYRARDRARRGVTFVVVGLLGLIVVNIGIAAVSKPHRVKPTPAPTPAVTVRPTAPAPSAVTRRTPIPGVTVSPSQVASLPLPNPAPAVEYRFALGALTEGGDIVLVDAPTGRITRVLVTHQPGEPVHDISWDGPNQIMYFDRDDGTCPTVWRLRLDVGRPELFANGSQPVVDRSGSRIAVRGSGCGPGNAQSDGVAIYDARTGKPISWTPAATQAADQDSLRVVDMDWRPDGHAIAVTMAGFDHYEYKLISVDSPPADLKKAAAIRMVYDFRERFYQLEYVGDRLLLVGHCCTGEIVQPTDRLVLRDAASGVLTTLTDKAATRVAADRRGLVYFLDAGPDAPGLLRQVIVPVRGASSVVDRRLGTAKFLRIDW